MDYCKYLKDAFFSFFLSSISLCLSLQSQIIHQIFHTSSPKKLINKRVPIYSDGRYFVQKNNNTNNNNSSNVFIFCTAHPHNPYVLESTTFVFFFCVTIAKCLPRIICAVCVASNDITLFL